VPLALFDLDNTLIDRAGAFRLWARSFTDRHRLGGEDEVGWLEDADEDGFSSRAAFFERVRARYDLRQPVEALVVAYRRDYPEFYPPASPETLASLGALRSRGWKLGIVTNGLPTQEAKIAAAGLTAAVDGWAISAVAGVSKPDRALFQAAADACGCTLEGAWMIGDNAAADIRGAVDCGLRTVWIRRSREWRTRDYRPDAIVDTVSEAVEHVLSTQGDTA